MCLSKFDLISGNHLAGRWRKWANLCCSNLNFKIAILEFYMSYFCGQYISLSQCVVLRYMFFVTVHAAANEESLLELFSPAVSGGSERGLTFPCGGGHQGVWYGSNRESLFPRSPSPPSGMRAVTQSDAILTKKVHKSYCKKLRYFTSTAFYILRGGE